MLNDRVPQLTNEINITNSALANVTNMRGSISSTVEVLESERAFYDELHIALHNELTHSEQKLATLEQKKRALDKAVGHLREREVLKREYAARHFATSLGLRALEERRGSLRVACRGRGVQTIGPLGLGARVFPAARVPSSTRPERPTRTLG